MRAIEELPPIRLRAILLLLVLWALQAPGGRALPGAQRSLVLGTRSQGHGALTLRTAIASTTAGELDIQKSQWGRRLGRGAGVRRRGAALRSRAFSTNRRMDRRGAVRAQGLASESLLFQEPTGPHTLCLPSRLWAPRLGGRVWAPGRLNLQA